MSSIEEILGPSRCLSQTRLSGPGPSGKIPLTPKMLEEEPSGHLFGLTQNAGMGWDPAASDGDSYLILSTLGGMRTPGGEPIALGYHTGHWELDGLVRRAAETLSRNSAVPFAAFCSDPCDGRSQGTAAMMDSLPYRNDAAIVLRRLIRSLPRRKGVLGMATCDKGLPAMLLALAGCSDLPGVLVPGGVTLPAEGAEDAGTVQTIGARFSHGMITLEYASEMGCRACGSPGGGCQFLGTAATAQVIAEGLGLSVPHSALAPSGEEVWFEGAERSARALLALHRQEIPLRKILTERSLENAMLLHAAFGGSTNLLLHLPAVAHSAGLKIPEVSDWIRVNKAVSRLVDVLPNGPVNHPTVHVFMAGGVPEVMLELRKLGLLHEDVLTVSGLSVGAVLDWWEESERRQLARRRLREAAGVDPGRVILSQEQARSRGLGATLVFPVGNLAPRGSVVKATAIDPQLLDDKGKYRKVGPVRVFTSEPAAISAIKEKRLSPEDILVLIGIGPAGTGMEEIYQITSALKFIPWGRTVPVLTDGRFSGVSTGPCIGHIGPEALAGGPIGRLRDGDRVEILIDGESLSGSVRLVGTADEALDEAEAEELLARRRPHPGLRPHEALPEDTRLWALLQAVSGGAWGGCVYDVGKIEKALLCDSNGISESFD